MNLLVKTLNWLWNSVGTLALIAAWMASFALPAWAVHASVMFTRYQPFSWVLAGFTGAVVFAGIVSLVAGARARWSDTNIRSRFYRDADRINPLERVFERRRIQVRDLVPPFINSVQEKTFDHCDIVGPANIILLANGGATLHGNTFFKTDAVSTSASAKPQTAIEFFNCRFINCNFYDVTLFMLEDVYDAANSTINGLNWITSPPQRPAIEGQDTGAQETK